MRRSAVRNAGRDFLTELRRLVVALKEVRPRHWGQVSGVQLGSQGDREGRAPIPGAGNSFVECFLSLWAPKGQRHAGNFGREGPKVTISGTFHSK